ncbi:hypothetical protein PR048_012231 [Dryococelus australis]|uniref:Uncharacterized protein n=1 Tax=Dryococelus australis TaxID=614101 RepID=A0ABQ9HP12_9NEOP|nr:hypothetical protein PR048_012231 [Dryococelus australis]
MLFLTETSNLQFQCLVLSDPQISASSSGTVTVNALNRCRTSSDVKVACQAEPVDSGDEVVSAEEMKIRFKLESGSEVNIPEKKNSEDTREALECYVGFKVKPESIVNLQCKFKNAVKYLDVRITNGDSTPILGLSACLLLNLVKRVHTMEPKTDSKLLTSQELPKN